MGKSIVFVSCLFAAISLAARDPGPSQLPAFPGAEGFGAYALGGRGGDVYTVTNLKDAGPGSLRFGLESATGPRTIVFALSGTIKLRSPLVISKDSVTVAGQTAPGDGICLRDAPLIIYADHVVVRYIRSRLGSESGVEADAISIARGHHVMVDHCSASWSVDECLSCSTGRKGEIDSITVQWCIISEALNNSIHSKGAHGYGALIRGCYGASYTYHHNLFAHNYTRNPRPGNYDYNHHTLDPLGLRFDFRNNVIYNWAGHYPGYDADTGSVCRFNYVGNYLRSGTDSELPGWAYNAGSRYFRAYFEGNSFNGNIPGDPWDLVKLGDDWSEMEKAAYRKQIPFPTGPVTTQTAEEAYEKVLTVCGASMNRDQVDERVVDEVRTGKGRIIDSQDEVGGWPVYNTAEARVDSDGDGMPDAWESDHGFDPANPGDRNGDEDGDGYTNLEEYLNQLVDSPGQTNPDK
ncbi:MAG: pectate lyase [Bacteroidales bacterium]